MAYTVEQHVNGLLQLIDPDEKLRAKRLLATNKGRSKWLERLAHNVEMHPQYAYEATKGARDPASILAALRQLTTDDRCYVFSALSDLDGTFQPLDRTVLEVGLLFDHGTVLSIVPGKLALFRPAAPSTERIVHRP